MAKKKSRPILTAFQRAGYAEGKDKIRERAEAAFAEELDGINERREQRRKELLMAEKLEGKKRKGRTPGKEYSGIYTQEQWRWVADRYLEGYTSIELARFLYVSRGTVLYHLNRMGLTHKDLPPLAELGFPRKEEGTDAGQ